jgi:hypothetical protein
VPFTQVYSAHQRSSSIRVPVPGGKPALLDVEIFDVNLA